MEKKWRFPGNGYARENGLNTGNMETFKKDPISSLARELCQNSIDAKIKGSTNPVRLEFSLFDVERNNIPAIDRISSEINRCHEYQKKNEVAEKELKSMYDASIEEYIPCLRISDFNTTGLKGISQNKGAYYNLTKGSGISEKSGTSGGSKGIGKYATFVSSRFNTAFYSTYTENEEIGYIGITELCSAPIEGSEEKTQGVGYYAINEKNDPILEKFVLDKNFDRTSYGTDIYILGFRNEKNWEKDIISNILESFLCAIYFGDLEVCVNGILLSKDNLPNILSSNYFANEEQKKLVNAQYLLLTDPTYADPIVIDDLGEACLYLKQYKKEEKDNAINSVVMVRYPYMKIRKFPIGSIVPCSAMCIIENNKLNEKLRAIENPQHTDWEENRILNTIERQEMKGIIRNLKKQINSIIAEHLKTSDNVSADVNGADEFLPDVGEGDSAEEINKSIVENITTTKKTKVKHKEKFGDVESTGESSTPDIGDFAEEKTGEAESPTGHNNSGGGQEHSGENNRGIDTEGENIIMKKSNLTGIKYKFIVLDKDNGKYAIVFFSPYTMGDLELKLYSILDNNGVEPVNIYEANVNGVEYETKFNSFSGFSIEKNKKVKIEIRTDRKELFASEVKIYASR